MRLSLSITNFTWPTGPAGLAQELQAIVEAADGGDIDTVWVNDHLLQAEPGTSRDEPMLEAYTTLGFLASASRRVRLGTMVTGVTFRPVALLVKAVTTVDVLSGGRAWLGIGAGYQQDEARAMGLPLPPTAERFELLADTVLLARRMWSGDASLFQGRRTRLEEPIGSPLPLTRGPTDRPGLPILIGGIGEKRTLRLVAEHADACNLFDIPDGGATVRHKLRVLAGHCAAVGRPALRGDRQDDQRPVRSGPAGGSVRRTLLRVGRAGHRARGGTHHGGLDTAGRRGLCSRGEGARHPMSRGGTSGLSGIFDTITFAPGRIRTCGQVLRSQGARARRHAHLRKHPSGVSGRPEVIWSEAVPARRRYRRPGPRRDGAPPCLQHPTARAPAHLGRTADAGPRRPADRLRHHARGRRCAAPGSVRRVRRRGTT